MRAALRTRGRGRAARAHDLSTSRARGRCSCFGCKFIIQRKSLSRGAKKQKTAEACTATVDSLCSAAGLASAHVPSALSSKIDPKLEAQLQQLQDLRGDEGKNRKALLQKAAAEELEVDTALKSADAKRLIELSQRPSGLQVRSSQARGAMSLGAMRTGIGAAGSCAGSLATPHQLDRDFDSVAGSAGEHHATSQAASHAASQTASQTASQEASHTGGAAATGSAMGDSQASDTEEEEDQGRFEPNQLTPPQTDHGKHPVYDS